MAEYLKCFRHRWVQYQQIEVWPINGGFYNCWACLDCSARKEELSPDIRIVFE